MPLLLIAAAVAAALPSIGNANPITYPDIEADTVIFKAPTESSGTDDLPLYGQPVAFGDTLDLTIYRTVQEGLTNAARHAEAHRVEVALTVEGGTSDAGYGGAVVLRLSDDGKGLPEPLTHGLGLTSMSHRVRVLGGSFEIGPRAGGGTEIRVRVPIDLDHVTAFPRDDGISS